MTPYLITLRCLGFSFIFLRNDPNVSRNVPEPWQNVSVALSKTEKAVYQLFKLQPNLTREELATEISKTVKTVQRALDGLKGKRFIARVGNTRTGYWEILQQLLF